MRRPLGKPVGLGALAGAPLFMAFFACRSGDSTLPPFSDANASDGAGTADALSLEGAPSPSVGTDEVAVPVALLHFTGRFDMTDPARPRFAWPGSAIAAHFTGTGIAVQLTDQGTNFFSVVIDGGAPFVLATSGPTRRYSLASGLAAGDHTLELTKRTESYVGTVQLIAMTVAGGTARPFPDSVTRRIEYVGDSITCGYGVLGASSGCHFSPETEDETVAYGALAAAALGASRTVVAYSGIGVLRDSAGSTIDQMPVRFERTMADEGSLGGANPWLFKTPSPQVVVINLGTNDFNGGNPGPAFQQAYVALVQQIRGHYLQANIVCTLSPMLGGTDRVLARAAIRNAVGQVTSAGDSRVVYFEFDPQNVIDGLGCDYHPNVKTQALMSAKLVPFIRTLAGW